MTDVTLLNVGDKFTIEPVFNCEGPDVCEAATMTFAFPADLKITEYDVSGNGVFDPVSNVWTLGDKMPGQYVGKFTFELLSDSSLPLSITANISSRNDQNLLNNQGTWVVNF